MEAKSLGPHTGAVGKRLTSWSKSQQRHATMAAVAIGLFVQSAKSVLACCIVKAITNADIV